MLEDKEKEGAKRKGLYKKVVGMVEEQQELLLAVVVPQILEL